MDNERHLDGNALAGLFHDVFGREMTHECACCSHCGAMNQLGAAWVFPIASNPRALQSTPVVQDGIEYRFVLSDYTGDGTLFGVRVPWAFNVTSGGTVIASPRSCWRETSV